MHTRYASSAFLLLALLFCSCRDGGTSPGSVEVKDSAGIRVVTTLTEPSLLPEVGVLEPDPDVVIGEMDGEPAYVFGSIRSARVLPDGRIVVTDGQALELRLFDASGKHLRTLGGRGGGPGEFLSVNSLSLSGEDTVCVWDSRSQRLTTFILDQGETGTHPAPGGSSRLFGVDCVGDGRFLLQSLWNPLTMETPQIPEGLTVRQDSSVLVLYDSGARRSDTVAVVPRLESAQGLANGMLTMQTLPFAREGRSAVVSDGIVSGFNDVFELEWLGWNGVPRMITRFPAYDEPLTDSRVSALRDRRLSVPGLAPEQAASIRKAFDELPHPDTRPAFGLVLPGSNGGVWVQEHPLWSDAESVPWFHINPATGEVDGFLNMPRSLHVFQIGPDYVLGRTTDDLGVERVVLFRWRRE